MKEHDLMQLKKGTDPAAPYFALTDEQIDGALKAVRITPTVTTPLSKLRLLCRAMYQFGQRDAKAEHAAQLETVRAAVADVAATVRVQSKSVQKRLAVQRQPRSALLVEQTGTAPDSPEPRQPKTDEQGE